MKQIIIELLGFPRALARNNIDLHDCAHAGHFDPGDRECRNCYQGPECEWLYSHDEFVALDRKGDDELTAALEFALGYVEAQVSFQRHKRNHCHCDACTWLRRAQRLYDEILSAGPAAGSGKASAGG